MSWREKLRPGSFRGVPFGVRSAPRTLGRRTAMHEFIQVDTPYIEDLGLLPRVFSLSAFVIGADYMEKRDALIKALEEPGPGTLVHPYYGELIVSLNGPVSVREGNDVGLGMAEFALSFAITENPVYPSGSRAPLSVAQSKVNSTASASASQLDNALQIASQGSWVFNQAVNATASAVARADSMSQGNIITITSTTAEALSLNQAEAVQILSSGAAGARLQGVFKRNASRSNATHLQKGDNYSALAQASPLVEIPENASSEHRISLENEAAINRCERQTITILMVEEYLAVIPDSRSQTRRIIANVQNRIDDVLAEAKSDIVYAEFSDLKASAVAALAHAGRQSPEIARVYTSVELPALVLAHRYSQKENDIESAALDFLRRNPAVHPGFMPPGEKEVLKYASTQRY